MPKQFEHDVNASIAEVSEALGVNGTFGGGAIENFRKGWAMAIFGGKKVHYWTRTDFRIVRSRCGLAAHVEWTDCNGKQQPTLYGGGGFEHCKRCDR